MYIQPTHVDVTNTYAVDGEPGRHEDEYQGHDAEGELCSHEVVFGVAQTVEGTLRWQDLVIHPVDDTPLPQSTVRPEEVVVPSRPRRWYSRLRRHYHQPVVRGDGHQPDHHPQPRQSSHQHEDPALEQHLVHLVVIMSHLGCDHRTVRAAAAPLLPVFLVILVRQILFSMFDTLHGVPGSDYRHNKTIELNTADRRRPPNALEGGRRSSVVKGTRTTRGRSPCCCSPQYDTVSTGRVSKRCASDLFDCG